MMENKPYHMKLEKYSGTGMEIENLDMVDINI